MPSEVFVSICTEQLLQIADHYEIRLADKKRKDDIKCVILSALLERGVPEKGEPVSEVASLPISSAGESGSVPVSNLTFEQQRELMLLFEQEKHKLRVEIESRMEIDKVRQETEKMKLDLIRDGKLSIELGAEVASVSGAVPRSCDMGANLRLLPKFSERDPDTFLTLFERIADVRGWPDVDRILMLKCVLTGRAQEGRAQATVRLSKLCKREIVSFESL